MKLLKRLRVFLPFMILFILLFSRLNTERKFQPVFSATYQTLNKHKMIGAESALKRLFVAQTLNTEWFATSFLKNAPIKQLKLSIAFLKKAGGKFNYIKKRNERSQFRYYVVLEKTIIPVRIVLDENNKIAQLRFGNPIANFKNLDEVTLQFSSLPGKVSLLVLEENSQLIKINPTNPLAVGSSFKLIVLKVLRDRITLEDKYSWKDTREIKNNLKSLPAGILQDWPEGSVLTIESLAALMMSLSDNTATDILIDWLGKKNIEALISQDNHPLLTTREWFIIKHNQAILERYRNANKKQKRSILAEIQDYPLPDLEQFLKDLTKPLAIDVEWLFSTQQLCSLIEEVRDLPIMKINSGMAIGIDKDDWKQITFKGGATPGVSNFTAWLQANNGKSYCVSATWNNPNESLDRGYFTSLYKGVLELLKTRTN